MKRETDAPTPTQAGLGLAVGVIALLVGVGAGARPPSWLAPDSMFPPACPDRIRRCQAAVEESKEPSARGISRVALFPS